MPKESKFQSELIIELRYLFPGCIILKNDEQYLQGFPDLTILYEDKWVVLECKRNSGEPYRPNQEYFLDKLNKMSYASMICPENKEGVLNDIQQTFNFKRRTRIPKCF